MKRTPRLFKALSTGCLGTMLLVIAGIILTSLIVLQIGAESQARSGELFWVKLILVIAIAVGGILPRLLPGVFPGKENKGL